MELFKTGLAGSFRELYPLIILGPIDPMAGVGLDDDASKVPKETERLGEGCIVQGLEFRVYRVYRL